MTHNRRNFFARALGGVAAFFVVKAAKVEPIKIAPTGSGMGPFVADSMTRLLLRGCLWPSDLSPRVRSIFVKRASMPWHESDDKNENCMVRLDGNYYTARPIGGGLMQLREPCASGQFMLHDKLTFGQRRRSSEPWRKMSGLDGDGFPVWTGQAD